MADIDAVLERLVNDSEFRTRLSEDPEAALAGYDLSAEDVELLAGSMAADGGVEHGVEQRTSKSALLGLIGAFAAGGSETAGEQNVLTVRRTAEGPAEGAGDLAAPPADAEVEQGTEQGTPRLHSVMGQFKYGNTGLNRDADPAALGEELAAPPSGEPGTDTAYQGTPIHTYAFKQGWPSKVESPGADDVVAPGGEAPAGSGIDQAWPLKVETGAGDGDAVQPASEELAAAPDDPEGIGLLLPAVQKVREAARSSGIAPDGDEFVTIEDE